MDSNAPGQASGGQEVLAATSTSAAGAAQADGGSADGAAPTQEQQQQASGGRSYEAVVKNEYRIPRFVPISPAPAPAPQQQEDGDGGDEAAAEEAESAAANGGGGGGGGGKKKQRGMNKKRPRDVRGEGDALCRVLMMTGECSFGADNCKSSHDILGYLARKEKDIGDSCMLFEQFGHCPSGITCRWGTSHIDAEKGTSVTRVDEATGQPCRFPEGVNVLGQEVLGLLRKDTYPLKTPRAAGARPGKGKHHHHHHHHHHQKQQQQPPKQAEAGAFNPEPLPERERRPIDFRDKVYVAPLTTVGNLPFRRVMKSLGADITCGEMALATNILMGSKSEAALLRRHPCEDVFGVQLAGAHPDVMMRVTELMMKEGVAVDFIDLNLGCPIDLVNNQGMGASLMSRTNKLKAIVTGMSDILRTTHPSPIQASSGGSGMYRLDSCPQITIKMRTGWDEKKPTAHTLVPQIQQWAATEGAMVGAVFVHGRSRQQRYSKLANWDYVKQVAQAQDEALPKIPVIGNGDILSFTDHEAHKAEFEGILEPCAMLGRGALIKPWLPTEIKERRHWDISASERLDILKDFVKYGLEQWGSDQRGVNNTRRFLLEWLSFLYRYVPVGVLEHVPVAINDRPMPFCGRNDLETLMASPFDRDWVKISEMLLGPVPDGFQFQPKHKANSYATGDPGSVSNG